MGRIMDVSIEIKENMVLWEGDAGVKARQVMALAKGDPYNLTRLYMSVHQGTHIDAPLHFLEKANSTDQYSLSAMVGPVQVVQINKSIDVIDRKALERCGIHSETKRILFKTHNSEWWRKRDNTFHKDYCGVNSDGANYLADLGMKLVGMDYLSISPMSDLEEPHRILMRKNIVILETINLADVEPGVYNLYCLPLKLVGTEGSPARVILTD
jgi:arylformamidase